MIYAKVKQSVYNPEKKHLADPHDRVRIYGKLQIGSSFYYLFQSQNAEAQAPNPHELYSPLWIDESIPKKGTLFGYSWGDDSWLEEFEHFESNDEAADVLLRPFEDDILRF